MVRIKTCRLTRNPQLGDPVAWLNLTLADGRELDDVALHRSPGGRWFFQGWGQLHIIVPMLSTWGLRNRWFADLYGAFPVKRLFLGFPHSSLFGAGKAVLRPVACDQVPGARGRGQGTETLAELGGVPP
jgi:hypothetical protein